MRMRADECPSSCETNLMKWSASFVVDGVDRGVVIEQRLHALRALRVVRIVDAVVERSQALRVLVVRRRTQRQQRLHTRTRCGKVIP